MRDEGGLDFHGAEAVAADVDDVVDAAHEPEVAVGVLARAVAGEVAAGNVGPVGFLIALGVAVDGAGHGGPWAADDEQAAVAGGDGMAFFGDDFRLDAEEGAGGGAGLGGDCAGDGRDEDGAGFGLPPGVDDGAAVVADLLAIPHPRFGIDGLADGAEQAERVELELFDVLVAPLDEGADGGGRGVEDGDLVVVDDLPEAGEVGPVGRAFVHEHGCAVLQRAVDDIGVAGDPADVGRAPVDVFVAEVEDVLGGEVGLDGVAAGGVDQALGLAGGAGGVEDVERIFGVERLGGAVGRGGGHEVVPPVVAAFDHFDGRAGALVDDDVLDGVAGGHGFVDGALELDLVAAAVAGVLGEDGDAGGVVDAVGDGVGGESAEDDGVDGADARAGEQGDGELGGHAHVDGDAIAFLDAEGLEGVGELLHFDVQLGVGEAADFAGLAFPDEGGLVGARAEDVAVDDSCS